MGGQCCAPRGWLIEEATIIWFEMKLKPTADVFIPPGMKLRLEDSAIVFIAQNPRSYIGEDRSTNFFF